MPKFRLKPPELTEKDVVYSCKQILQYRGYYVYPAITGTYKTLDGKRFVHIGELGFPDCIAMHPKFPALLLEFKRPRKLPKKHQAEKMAELRDVYGLSVIAVDCVEALIDWLNKNHEDRSYRHGSVTQ